jgi:hypothetical protein
MDYLGVRKQIPSIYIKLMSSDSFAIFANEHDFNIDFQGRRSRATCEIPAPEGATRG